MIFSCLKVFSCVLFALRTASVRRGLSVYSHSRLRLFAFSLAFASAKVRHFLGSCNRFRKKWGEREAHFFHVEPTPSPSPGEGGPAQGARGRARHCCSLFVRSLFVPQLFVRQPSKSSRFGLPSLGEGWGWAFPFGLPSLGEGLGVGCSPPRAGALPFVDSEQRTNEQRTDNWNVIGWRGQ